MYSFKNPKFESDLTSKTSSDSQDSSLRSRSRNSISLKSCEPLKIMLETTLSMKNLLQDIKKLEPENTNPETGHAESTNFVPQPVVYFSPRPISELNDAATRIQKVYKSYRTRRNLADAAAFVEELWLKTLEFAALDRSSVNGVEVVQQ